MIKTSYDPEADALSVRFAPDDARYEGSEEVAPGVMLDFDAEGRVIAVEVLDVQKRATGRYPAQLRKPAAAE